MDEQPHYLGISFPGCQVQRVTAFGISHIGQRVIPQKNLNHIPRKQKSIMSLQNSGVLPTNRFLYTYVIAQSTFTGTISLGSPVST